MRRIFAFTACWMTLFVTNVHADNGNWYGAIKASLGAVTIDNVTDRGTIGTGAAIGPFIDGQLDDTTLDDVTAGLGFAVGRRFGNWALEAELDYRYRTDFDIAAPTPSIATVTNVFANVETTSLLVNLVRRGVLTERWSWETGLGIGVVLNRIDADFVEREVPGVRPELRVNASNRETDFSFNGIVGVTRDLRGPWTLNLRYRFIDLGDVSAGPFPDRAVRVFGEHTSQELLVSFERDFR